MYLKSITFKKKYKASGIPRVLSFHFESMPSKDKQKTILILKYIFTTVGFY